VRDLASLSFAYRISPVVTVRFWPWSADHYTRVSPTIYPDLHSLVTPPFFKAPAGGGMPLFNEIFIFFWFHAFVKFNNMFDVLAIRNGQSYNSLIARTHPTLDGSSHASTEHIINENTIAYLHLCVICSLDAGVTLKRQKTAIYNQYVAALKLLNGKEGRRDWRVELAEKLTKHHDQFKAVTKTKRDPTTHFLLSPGQVDEEVDADFL
jgi:hypothetical protein